MPLASIKDILDDAAMAPHVLKQQQQKLLKEAAHLQRMVRAVDERFSASYRGAAPYLLRLIEGAAEKAGLDLEEISWG